MCTVTWLPGRNEYRLFFNRDERKTRKPAAPPALHEHHGVRQLYPVDGTAGGTWLGVNEYGVTVGILNHYVAERADRPGRVSRR